MPEYTLKVTVPVGLTPPVTVAVSLTDEPTTTEDDESEVLTARAPPTLTASLPHPLETGLLLLSPP